MLFEEYRYVLLETRDDALIDVLYNIKNIAIFFKRLFTSASGEQLIVWDK